MSEREQERQHSKATLIKAAKILFLKNQTIEAELRRRWRRRVVLAAAAALATGFAAGLYVGGLTLKRAERILLSETEVAPSRFH